MSAFLGALSFIGERRTRMGLWGGIGSHGIAEGVVGS